jgi:hypothetical protein
MIVNHYELETNSLSIVIFCLKYLFLLGVRSGVLNNGKSQSFSLVRVAVAILFLFNRRSEVKNKYLFLIIFREKKKQIQ